MTVPPVAVLHYGDQQVRDSSFLPWRWGVSSRTRGSQEPGLPGRFLQSPESPPRRDSAAWGPM